MEELSEVISNLNPKKAPGIDCLAPPIIQRAFSVIPDLFLHLYNACLSQGTFPDIWKIAIIRPLLKPGRDRTSPSSYRPISLLPVLGKILDRLLLNRLRWYLYSHHLMSSKQFGFTPQTSTEDALHRLTSIISPILHNGGYCILVSLDVAGAYDKAWIPLILSELRRKACPFNIYNTYSDFFRNRTSCILLENERVLYSPTRGVPQGSPSSPLLWNILYDTLLTLPLSDKDDFVAFADDLTVLSWGYDLPALERRMNSILRQILQWSHTSHTEFNPSKCQSILFTTKRIQSYPSLFFNDVALSFATELRILGLIFDTKLRWHAHLSTIIAKAKRLHFSLSSMAKLTWGLDSHAARIIYKGAIEPFLLYGISVWGSCLHRQSYKTKLLSLQRLFALKIIRGYCTISQPVSLLLAQLIPLPLLAMELQQLYLVKHNSPSSSSVPSPMIPLFLFILYLIQLLA